MHPFIPNMILLNNSLLQMSHSLADLGGHEGRTPPLGVQILSISCSFRENLACSRPPWRVHAPLGKILDLPLTLNNSLGNTIIPSQRLVTMSVSLRTQTVSHCLIIQVLNIKSLLPKCLIQSLSLLYTVI